MQVNVSLMFYDNFCQTSGQSIRYTILPLCEQVMQKGALCTLCKIND